MSWPTARLEEMTEQERSITYGVVKPGPEDIENGIRFVRGGDIKDGKIAIGSLRTITEAVSKRYSRTLLRGGEILVSLVGNPGEAAVVPDELAGANIARQAGVIALRSEFNPKFVEYFLRSPRGRSELFQRTKGSVQQVINLADLKTVQVPQPDEVVQKRIVSILAAYDDLIENNRRRITLLEETARLLYREWFVHFRFPGHEHVKIIDGVPKGWEKTKLGKVADTNPESYKKGKLPERLNYIDISSVSQGRIDHKTEMDSEVAPGRARRIARHGDTIWSNVRPNLRAYSIVLNPEDNDVFSTGFTILRANKIGPALLYFFATSDAFVEHLVNHATGTSYPAVRPEDFEKAEVLVPSSDLLVSFEEFCEPIFRQIELLNRKATESANARDLLLPRLMDGRLEV